MLAKILSTMAAAITFSRQNDAGSRASTTQNWENLVLVVGLVIIEKWIRYLGFTWAEIRYHFPCDGIDVTQCNSERFLSRHQSFIC